MKKLYVKNSDNFYKKIFFYKSFLYRFVEFYSDDTDEMFKKTIEALNIKNRKKRIKYIYDYCCDLIDNHNKGKNICGFNENGQCYSQQRPGCNYKNGCCRLCAYQSSNGCPSSNLSCKLYYCEQVKSRYNVIEYKNLKILKLLTLRQRLIVRDDFFVEKEKVLKDLYIGILVVYALKMVFRLMINFFKLVKNKQLK